MYKLKFCMLLWVETPCIVWVETRCIVWVEICLFFLFSLVLLSRYLILIAKLHKKVNIYNLLLEKCVAIWKNVELLCFLLYSLQANLLGRRFKRVVVQKLYKNRESVSIKKRQSFETQIIASLWSWWDSNPRPNRETIRFLHAYSGLRFSWRNKTQTTNRALIL